MNPMNGQKIETRHFINNDYIGSPTGELFTIRNPASDDIVAEFHAADEREIDIAVSAARKAFKSGLWSTFTAVQRAKCLLKFADLLEERADDIANLDPMCMGIPIMFVKRVLIPSCVETFRYYAGYADKIAGQSFQEKDGFYKIVQYEPIGVCAGIAAWNATLIFIGWKIAPALAAGNTFIFKASEKNPFSSLAVAGLFKEAGFPDGVVNFVSGGAKTGSLLASHMDIDKISFTGSGATGRKIQDAATKSTMKRVTLELGGKSPAIVFGDANMEVAVKGCSEGFLILSGQVCAAASRTFVHSSIAENFIFRLKEAFKSATGAMGPDPSQMTTILGPLADKVQFDRVMSYIDSGKSEAELVVGGQREGTVGCFVQPTIFLNPQKNAKVYKEEVFGPVITISTFETEEEVIELANDTTYGLSACVYTSDMPRALRVAGKIQAGTVAINSNYMPDIQVPFGGFKQSGQGRECGREGLDAYLQAKSIKINMNVPPGKH